jgi:hypothetical protein
MTSDEGRDTVADVHEVRRQLLRMMATDGGR